jgi:hypothetical protein
MNARFIIAVFAGAALAVSAAHAQSPARVGDAQRSAASELGDRDLQVDADFNGDGDMDVAFFRQTPNGVSLVTRIAGAGEVVLQDVSRKHFDSIGISPAPPQTYVAACAKGYGRACGRDEPTSVTTTHAGLFLSYAEASNSLLYWQGSGFARLPLTD